MRFQNIFRPVKKSSHIKNLNWNEQKFRSFMTQLQSEYKKIWHDKATSRYTDWEDEQPLWVQNRKLLVRVFIGWIILLILLLFNVLSTSTFL